MDKQIRDFLNNDQFRKYCLARARAKNATVRAIKLGILPRLGIKQRSLRKVRCVDCNKWATSYDHRDYYEYYKVDPVCTICNRRRGMAMATIEKILNNVELPSCVVPWDD